MGESSTSFYGGGFSSFEPNYANSNSNFTGFYMNAGQLSSNTNPGVANQIKEVVSRIKEGVHNVELGTISPDMLESIPKQHFEEIKALLKLSGVDASIHAPIQGMDPAGFTNRGFDNEQRKEVERRFFASLQAAKTISPDKGINVVMHAANNGGPGGGAGSTYRPGDSSVGEDRFVPTSMGIVERDTGNFVTQLKEDKKIKFDNPDDFGKGGTLDTTKDRLDHYNKQIWKNTLSGIGDIMQNMDIELRRNDVEGTMLSMLDGSKNKNIDRNSLTNEDEINAMRSMDRAQIFVDAAKNRFDDAFENAYKYGDDNQKRELTNLATNFRRNVSGADRDSPIYLENYRKELDNALAKLSSITKDSAPKLLESAEDYAKRESAKTFANLAWRSFDELGKRNADKAPVIAIENLYQGNTMATAKDMEDLVKKSRENFEKIAIDKGLSKSEAKKAADKLIGVTWDVGHLNMFKASGFTDKDLVDQTKQISKYVKHVHLTDNFGHADTHLAMGMGNVPIKEHLKELEKNGKFTEMKKVIEAGGLIANQLSDSQFKPTLESFGAQMYGPSGGYWSNASGMASSGGYFGGQGEILPDKHFSIYGSGFSSLPTSMGGRVGANSSRVTGTPMA